MEKIHLLLKKMIGTTLVMLLGLLSMQTAFGQAPCYQCGNGSGGVYAPVSNTTLAGGTYQFSSVNIPSGITISVTGTQPLIIQCTGAVIINGVIQANGGNGGDGVTFVTFGTGGVGVAGGANGGNGAYSDFSGPLNGFPGFGLGAGLQGMGWSGGGGAGHSVMGGSSGGGGGSNGGPAYGDPLLNTMNGGSGGGGGSGGFSCGSGGGGAGGGSILISSCVSITIGPNGAIQCRGGNGGSDGFGNCGGGGAGSGGSIRLNAPTITNSGSLDVAGGVGGASTVPGNPYFGAGADGSAGRTRLYTGAPCLNVANDICANAIPLACGDLWSGTTTGALDDIALGQAPNCSGGSSAGGVWYSFVGNGGTAIVNTCPFATYDTKLAIYQGTCGALTCVGNNDDFCGTKSQVSIPTVAGTTYYILVYGNNQTGDFNLQLICIPPNGSATVACPSLATQPTPPVVFNGCGQIIPTGPVITDNPNPLICEGTRTFTWTYNDNCGPSFNGSNGEKSSNSFVVAGTWSFTYTIERLPFTITAPNGSAQVACPALAVAPTPPVVMSNCGEILPTPTPVITNNPNPIACEGTRTYAYTYVDCEGNTATWTFTYTIERNPFTITAPNGSAQVACLALATPPTPPVVTSNCGETLPTPTPTITDLPSPLSCEGTRTYVYVYVDCEGNTATWTFTYTIERNPFTITAPNGSAQVACPALAVPPTPPVVTSSCGETLPTPTPTITDLPSPLTCEGTRTYVYVYTDCEGNQATWSFVYTIERNPFTVPANGAAQVACPALAVTPTPPVVTSNCGEVLPTPTPVITNVPNPIACEGTRTYAYTYTDCEGNQATWSFVYTIERNPFTITTPNGASTVACPSQIVQPVPPTVSSNCGEVLTPTGPVIVNNPNPITCEGTRTFIWTYTDCEGNTATWSHVVTVERNPFSVPANGGSTVACPDLTDAVPTPPVVLSNCGEVLTPVVTSTAKPGCEGQRNWNFTYTDCEGNTATWVYIYMVEYQDFIVPTSVVGSVECPFNAFQPTPPTIHDNCGKLLNAIGPVITSMPNAYGCEGSRKYTWTYSDCEGNTHSWSQTFNFLYSADFIVYPDKESTVACLLYAQNPIMPPTLYDICGQPLHVSGPVVTENLTANGCAGTRKFTFVYSDCGGHSHPWSFIFYINDDQGPMGTCPSSNAGSGPIALNVTNLSCIEEVPCPTTYDFEPKVEELLVAGNIFDACSGDDLVVTLDSYTDLWQCSDADGNGVYTFGRTFYFHIADPCGNEFPDLCSVTYSGNCQPLETFPMSAWGISGDAPGTSVSAATTDLAVIQALIGTNPLQVGGGNRSLTLTDAQCVMDLLPGVGGPAVLANCHQTNCTGGCNPAGPLGMKNSLAANAIALTLNMRFNVQYNGLTMANVRNQSLGCIGLHECIYSCTAGGCQLRVFDAAGNIYTYPYTVGGLLDLANYYLGGNLDLSVGQSVLYATALNKSLMNVNAYWNEGQTATSCNPDAGVLPIENEEKALPTGKPGLSGEVFSLAPNPAGSEVTFKLAEMSERQEVIFELYNQLGQLALRKNFGKVTYINERIDLSNIGSGLYIVSVKAGTERFEQKLVVSKN